MQSKATNSSRLSAYHFVLKCPMTNAHEINHHNPGAPMRRGRCAGKGARKNPAAAIPVERIGTTSGRLGKEIE